jgi:DNA-binding NtrC family response regulator
MSIAVAQTKKKPVVLICDDDELFHLALKHTLKSRFEVISAYHGDETLAILRNRAVDVLLLDIQMRDAEEGLNYLPRFRAVDPQLSIIMSSGLTDFETVRRAMQLSWARAIIFLKTFNPKKF